MQIVWSLTRGQWNGSPKLLVVAILRFVKLKHSRILYSEDSPSKQFLAHAGFRPHPVDNCDCGNMMDDHWEDQMHLMKGLYGDLEVFKYGFSDRGVPTRKKRPTLSNSTRGQQKGWNKSSLVTIQQCAKFQPLSSKYAQLSAPLPRQTSFLLVLAAPWPGRDRRNPKLVLHVGGHRVSRMARVAGCPVGLYLWQKISADPQLEEMHWRYWAVRKMELVSTSLSSWTSWQVRKAQLVWR